MSPAALRNIESYVNEGGNILATGKTSAYDAHGNLLDKVMLACAGIKEICKIIPQEKECT